MAKIWKVIGIVMSVLVIGVLGFCGIWTVRNWDIVYSSFDGTSFYTYEDMQKLKQDTIEESAKNEVKYQEMIDSLKENIINLEDKNKSLEEEKQALHEDSEMYRNFYENYWTDDICRVNIMSVSNVLLDNVFVDTGTLLSDLVNKIGEPESEDSNFYGWALDPKDSSDDFLDPTTYEITSDLTLYAIFTPKLSIY